MGFLTNILSATVKTALTPVSVIKDVGNVLTDEKVDSTEKLLDNVSEDIDDAFDDLIEGDLF